MAVGLPVAAQRMGSNPEVIEHGVKGFLVDTQRYRSLKTLVHDRDLRRRMGAAARAMAVDRFSVEANADRVLSVFERAAGGSQMTPRPSGEPVRAATVAVGRPASACSGSADLGEG